MSNVKFENKQSGIELTYV